MLITQNIDQAAQIIKSGGIVAFPTETVYGLGADALNPQAVAQIYKTKERPSKNPLIVHIHSLDQLNQITREIPPIAQKLIEKFWPGPLTIILPKSKIVPDITTAGLDTVAVRMPDHPIAIELIKQSNTPIAAPSANKSGKPSPTKFIHVQSELGDKVDAILEGQPSKYGVESTVINPLTTPPTILRHGAISKEEIEDLLNTKVSQARQDSPIQSPGMAFRHYAPDAPLVLLSRNQITKQYISKLIDKYNAKNPIYLCSAETEAIIPNNTKRIILGSRQNLAEIASNIFDALIQCNQLNVDLIICESYPPSGIGKAIMDRLNRAAEI